jgi:hypothetical protein
MHGSERKAMNLEDSFTAVSLVDQNEPRVNINISQLCEVNQEILFDVLYATLNAWMSISDMQAMNRLVYIDCRSESNAN